MPNTPQLATVLEITDPEAAKREKAVIGEMEGIAHTMEHCRREMERLEAKRQEIVEQAIRERKVLLVPAPQKAEIYGPGGAVVN